MYNYKLIDLHKLNENTWIEYFDLYRIGTTFTHKIKNIPKDHFPVRFRLLEKEVVDLYKLKGIEE